jgi:tRNA modification GTPase
MLHSGDTIAAISSATGPAARMIVRIGGAQAWRIAAEIAPGLPAGPNSATRLTLSFASLHVPSWAYVFRAPRSYTGDDLIELHLPGNPVLARLLLGEVLRRGARAAEPGEFTARAYFNGRLDLTGAEGVAATIAAGSEAELLAARQLLAGELARRLRPAMDAIAQTLALVEVGIDFSDEDVSFIAPELAEQRIDTARSHLRDLLESSARFERLAHEPQLVLVGRPNAGKSTLLNALAGHARAVTSPIAGTTRDVLTAEVALPRGIARVIDVAGLDDASESAGEIDSQGALADIGRRMRELALHAVESADHVILVCDPADARPLLKVPVEPSLVVWTKADLAADGDGVESSCSLPRYSGGGLGRGFAQSTPAGITPSPALPRSTGGGRNALCPPTVETTPDANARPATQGAVPHLTVSALTGENLDGLRSALDQLAFGGPASGATLALNARHLRSIDQALAALGRAAGLTRERSPEFLALELREALDALGQVLGQVSPDDLLGRIFSSFCIGK